LHWTKDGFDLKNMKQNNLLVEKEFPEIKKAENSNKTKGRPPGSIRKPKPGMILSQPISEKNRFSRCN